MPEYLPIPPDRQQALRRALVWSLTASTLIYLTGWTLFLARPHLAVIGLAVTAALALNATAAVYTSRRVLRLRFRQHPALPYPLSFRYQLAGSAAYCSIFAMVHAGLYTLSPGLSGIALGMLVTAPPMALGLALLFTGLNAREPSVPCCPRCAYPADTIVFPAMCPECALPLPSFAATTTTPHIRRPLHAWAGASICTISLIFFASAMFKPSTTLSALPIEARIRLAARDKAVFRAIDTTTLPPDRRDRLIDAILAARPEQPTYALRDQLEWVAMELQLGRLTPAQSDTFATDGFRLRITIDPAKPGRDLPLTLSLAADVPALPYTINAKYFLAELTVNGQAVLTPGPDPFDTDDLAMDWPNRQHLAERTEYRQPTAPFTPTTTNPLHVRARIINILTSTTATPTITRHPDGTYTITPPPLTTHEHTAETTITVTD